MSPVKPLLMTESTAALQLVEGLAAGGVPIAFGLDDPRGLFAALRRSSVRAAVVHDERAGGYMADGYARASGLPVACAGISGPGAVNLAPALLEAWASCVPLVAVVGEFEAPRPGLRAFQEVEHASFLGAGLTKEVIEVRRASELRVAGEMAARIARTGRPRPVLLLISDPLLWEEIVPEDDPPLPSPGPVAAPGGADGAAVAEAAGRLAHAQRPVILAGAGVHVAAAYDELVAVAERYGVPVATSMSGKGAIDETHPLALGVAGAYTSGREGRGALPLRCLREADAILAVGSDLDALTTTEWAWPAADATLIRIDVDADELRGLPAINLWGDARATLRQLSDHAPATLGDERQRWLRSLSEEAAAVRDRLRAADRGRDEAGTVWPGAVMAEIDARLAPADWVVGDASYSSSWVLDRIVQRRAGRQVLAPRGVGTLGWSVPAGMGVQLAAPDAQVTVVTGDGALFYALPDMETAARWGLGVNVVMLDNGVYGSQRLSNLAAQGKDYEDLHFGGRLDHVALARSLGWQAVRVADQPAFADAYAAARESSEPWLIAVATAPDSRPPLTKFD